MATYRAIAATSQAVLGLLEEACPRDEFADARFRLVQSSDFQSETPALGEGITLFLYRVAVNGSARNLPPRTGPDGRRFRPSLPLDLHYLLTAWGRSVEQQQRLLGWAVRTLEDTAILPSGLLNHYGPEATTFRPNEAVELVFEPLSLQDFNNIWEGLRPFLSVPYLARMVAIESDVQLTEAGPAQTRAFSLGVPAEQRS
ncbi:MAG: DUF4255 domain-containing protein [Chloroflexales bacterium]|nr:DUF4255 domain-containing protein [Chloroflexales bacterium]